MFWIYLVIFIIAVLVPDIIRNGFYFLPENQIEELTIFLLGIFGFALFIFLEQKLSLKEKESQKNLKKLDQTTKDLVESYSYIGEVNRKLDILMQIALGLSDRNVLSSKREKDIYHSILEASLLMMNAKCALIKFVNIENRHTEKEIKTQGCTIALNNSFLLSLQENIHVAKKEDSLVISSRNAIKDIKCFLIIADSDKESEKKPHNIEILKVFVSQALFLHSFAQGSANK